MRRRLSLSCPALQLDALSFYLSAPVEVELQLSVKIAGQWISLDAQQGTIANTGWNTIAVPDSVPPPMGSSRACASSSRAFTPAPSSASCCSSIRASASISRCCPAGARGAPGGHVPGRRAVLRALCLRAVSWRQPMTVPARPRSASAGCRCRKPHGAFGVLIGRRTTWSMAARTSSAAQGDDEAWWVEVKATWASDRRASRASWISATRSPRRRLFAQTTSVNVAPRPRSPPRARRPSRMTNRSWWSTGGTGRDRHHHHHPRRSPQDSS